MVYVNVFLFAFQIWVGVVFPVLTMSIFETGTIESAYGHDSICYQLYITYLFSSEYYIIEYTNDVAGQPTISF